MTHVLKTVLLVSLALLFLLPPAGQMMSSAMEHGMTTTQCIEHCLRASRPEAIAIVPFIAAVLFAVLLFRRMFLRTEVARTILRTFFDDNVKLLRKLLLETVVLRN